MLRFDFDGSRQMILLEYIESVRFLGNRESDEVLTQAFRSVDVDNSGQIDWPEYVFSVLGSKAAQYGTLARMEELSTLLDSAAGLLDNLRGSLAESQASQAARAKRNAQLLERMKNMKNDSNKQVSAFLSKMFALSGKDPTAMLSEVINFELLVGKFLFLTVFNFKTS